jgi:hypothetical protein
LFLEEEEWDDLRVVRPRVVIEVIGEREVGEAAREWRDDEVIRAGPRRSSRSSPDLFL